MNEYERHDHRTDHGPDEAGRRSVDDRMASTAVTTEEPVARYRAAEDPSYRSDAPHDGGTPSQGWGQASAGASAPRRPSLLITILIAALVAAGTSLGVTALVDSSDNAAGGAATEAEPEIEPTNASTTPSDGEGLSVAEVAASAAPSVAAVEVTVGGGSSSGGPGGSGLGSAVIIDADGVLVTNNHVVERASSVTVTLADGERHEAEVVGTDPTTDLAVLSIDATGLPAAELAAELPDIGTTAVAIGSPFGLEGSVSSGIVSAVDRTLSGASGNLTGLIQTDAAINPGNSGGALLDDRGRVIGINTAILSRSGANDGVGFAVASTVVADITDQLVRTGTVARAELGIQGQNVDPRVAAAYGLGVEAGALIVAVMPDSAAGEAGLAPGDIVTSADGEEISSMADLAAAVRSHQPGESIDLEFRREGENRNITVELQ